MRYLITRRFRADPDSAVHSTNPVKIGATNKTMAAVAFEDQAKLLEPGQEVLWTDQQTGMTERSRYLRTPLERHQEAQEMLTRFIDGFVKEGMDDLTTISAKFAASAADPEADPCYDFEWLDGRFMGAARLWVGRWLGARREKLTLQQLLVHAEAQMIWGARSPSRSTAVSHNLMHQCKTAAWAEAHEKLTELVRWADGRDA